jgi:FdhD protein
MQRANSITTREITSFSDENQPGIKNDFVVKESLLRIVCNNQDIAVLSYLPDMQKEFAFGYLLANGLISSVEDVLKYDYSDERETVFMQIRQKLPAAILHSSSKATGSGCAASPQVISIDGLEQLPLKLKISSELIQKAIYDLQCNSVLFNETGGVHSAMLCRSDGTKIVRADDIGRHNAVDKIIGACLLHKDINPAECFAVSTGRLSSEIVIKAWRAGLQIIASRSSTTSRFTQVLKEFMSVNQEFAEIGRYFLKL